MLSDTHPDAEAVLIGLLCHKATVEQRLARTAQLTQMVRDMARQAIAQARPEAVASRARPPVCRSCLTWREWAARRRDHLARREA